MLKSVASALNKFLSPITSAREQQAGKFGSSPNRDEKRKGESPPNNVVELRPNAAPNEPAKPVRTEVETFAMSVSTSLLQLVQKIRDKKGNIMNRMAANSYHQLSKGQRKSRRIKKGLMMDEKIE